MSTTHRWRLPSGNSVPCEATGRLQKLVSDDSSGACVGSRSTRGIGVEASEMEDDGTSKALTVAAAARLAVEGRLPASSCATARSKWATRAVCSPKPTGADYVESDGVVVDDRSNIGDPGKDGFRVAREPCSF